MSDTSIQEPGEWNLHLTIKPSADGKWVAITIRLDKPSSRVPTYINSADSMDMIFEKVQGELNNALRQLVNDIHQMVVKPLKGRK